MKTNSEIGLDFEVDKLTNSIENTITGDSFATEVSLATTRDLKALVKQKHWKFNWMNEYQQSEREVYKLTIVNNELIIQGLISMENMIDHVYIHLIESAPFNQGKAKMYSGVSGNLVAFACRYSFRCGHKGNVAFTSKTSLIKHYEESLGALHCGGHRMIIDAVAAYKLTNRYFK